ncbi:MAG: glycosyltransferase family 1 protein [Patescibacteria group bacterium]|nr:glycosyltransferase family 1 protein [Patescibacteria group bacterium]
MRIGIDCRTILNPEKNIGGGVGHYTYQLVRHLLKIDKKNTYVLFFDRSVQKRRLAKFKQSNVLIRFFPFVQYTRLMPKSYTNYLISAYLNKEELDVFHSPTLSLPFSYKKPCVVTAHDLAIYKFPEFYSDKHNVLSKTEIPTAIKDAKKIITASHSTAKDIHETFGTSIDKIKMVIHGLDERFFDKQSEDSIQKIKSKYGIKKDYLLFLGTLDLRKNIIRIISAYERLREKMKSNSLPDIQLVLAGAKGFKFHDIEKKISASKYKKDIILPGYIAADDLNPLFGGAKVFVFPSFYEGFGLSILEAMANGIPVVTSNVSAMPETAGGHAVLVDLYDVSQINEALYRLLTNKELRDKLSEEGKRYAQKFNWDKTAEETLKIYKEASIL